MPLVFHLCLLTAGKDEQTLDLTLLLLEDSEMKLIRS